MSTLIRFTLLTRDPESGSTQGILTAAHDLRDSEQVSAQEHSQIRIALDWFNSEVVIPTPLKETGTHRAISWFKPKAKEAIQRMWELKEILEYHNMPVEVLKSSSPGTIIYEDEWQVVAIPRKKKK